MDENQEAWALWRHIQTQVRTSFAGVVGIDYVAAREVAEVLGIDLDLAMLHKVQTLESVMLQEVSKVITHCFESSRTEIISFNP